MSQGCTHLAQVADVTPSSEGCEDWWFCYIDDIAFSVAGAPSYEHP